MSASKWLLKATACALTAIILLSGCASDAPAQTYQIPEGLGTPSKTTYKTTDVKIDDYTVTSTGSASVVQMVTAELKWEGGNARYGQALVEKNQQVKQGDILMQFDVESSQADLSALRLERSRLSQDLEAQKAVLMEQINAKKQEAAYLDSYDRRIAELEATKMEAAYDAYIFNATQSIYDVDAKIHELEEVAENNVLVAPFDGVIDSVIRFNPGDPVSKSSVLVTMHAPDKILIEASDSSGKLHYNMPIVIQINTRGSSKEMAGFVASSPNIMPHSISQDKVLIQLYGTLSENDLKATLRYSAETETVHNVLTASAKAVNHKSGTDFVYVLEDGTLKKKYVVTKSNLSDPVWILEGLSEGQTLVVD